MVLALTMRITALTFDYINPPAILLLICIMSVSLIQQKSNARENMTIEGFIQLSRIVLLLIIVPETIIFGAMIMIYLEVAGDSSRDTHQSVRLWKSRLKRSPPQYRSLFISMSRKWDYNLYCDDDETLLCHMH
jgi:hypothetical protein